jgi:hypothetical protein
MKKACKECPWIIENNHNKKWRQWTKDINLQHRCHMIDSKNIWTEPNDKNKCVGQCGKNL